MRKAFCGHVRSAVGILLAACGAWAAEPSKEPPAPTERGPYGPTFAEVYRGYRPDFAVDDHTLAQWKEEPDGAPTWTPASWTSGSSPATRSWARRRRTRSF